VAWVSGWVEVDGVRHDAERWFGARDHSWGVRPGVGGFEPQTGAPGPGGMMFMSQSVFFWLAYLADDGHGGYLRLMYNDPGSQRRVLGGGLRYPEGDGVREVGIVDAEIDDLAFFEGTNVAKRVALTVLTAEGGKVVIEGDTPLLSAPWAYRGTGYDGGYDDGNGLGHYRGEYVEEIDTYDVSHPEDVVMPNGESVRLPHREGAFRLRVDGVPAWSHFPIFARGPLPQWGLA
jgi:hypothetical protein